SRSHVSSNASHSSGSSRILVRPLSATTLRLIRRLTGTAAPPVNEGTEDHNRIKRRFARRPHFPRHCNHERFFLPADAGKALARPYHASSPPRRRSYRGCSSTRHGPPPGGCPGSPAATLRTRPACP